MQTTMIVNTLLTDDFQLVSKLYGFIKGTLLILWVDLSFFMKVNIFIFHRKQELLSLFIVSQKII